MPTYAYKCDECNHQFEKIQKMSDEPLKLCPSCNNEKLKKIITASGGFALKGKGWFKSGGYQATYHKYPYYYNVGVLNVAL